jgi:hypothetical protein
MADITTTTLIKYELFDKSAAENATCTTSTGQSFSDTSKLTTGTSFGKFATSERNFFVLDGTMNIFSSKPEVISYFSKQMSNKDGLFTKNPTIDIKFTENHSSIALGLFFVDEHPLRCVATWKSLEGTVLQKKYVDISSNHTIIDCPVTNYGAITIEFIQAAPYRYVKIDKIEFGKILTWDESNIISGNLLEEIDLTGETIPINTLDFKIFDEAGDYNVGNSSGYHQYVQKGQNILPYEIVNGEPIYLGRYYVSSISESTNSVEFKCEDIMKYLDGVTFYKGDIYNKALVGPIIESILATGGVTDYLIDDAVYNSTISGYLPPMSCRNALAKITFATTSLVSAKRTDTLHFYKDDGKIRSLIERTRKISTKVTKRDYVSGVSLSFSTFKLSQNVREIVKGVYPAGLNLITFNDPYSNISVSNGTIVESGKFYCIVKLNAESSVTVSGTEYTKSELTSIVRADKLEGGEVENIIAYSDVMADADTVSTLGKSLLRYLQYRLEIDVKYMANDEILSNWCIVKNPVSSYNDYIAGIQSISTDLVGGYISQAKLIGYYDYSDFTYFAGEELFAPDSFIV